MFACWDPPHNAFLYNRPGREGMNAATPVPFDTTTSSVSSPLYFGNSVREVLVSRFHSCAVGTRRENSGGKKIIPT